MKRAVITVYLSLIIILVFSLSMALLESVRSYSVNTAARRYVNMAAEMLFSEYCRPCAERYDLFVLQAGGTGGREEAFRGHLEHNMSAGGRSFGFSQRLNKVSISGEKSLRDDGWRAFKDQIKRSVKYGAGENAMKLLESFLSAAGKDTGESVKTDYLEMLADEETRSEIAQEEKAEEERRQAESIEADGGWDGPAEEETVLDEPTLPDPREGISEWIRQGVLRIVVGDKEISDKSIDTGSCSYHVQQDTAPQLSGGFDTYADASQMISAGDEDIFAKIKTGLGYGADRAAMSLYAMRHFGSFAGEAKEGAPQALKYELEYIVSGKASDQENLEAALIRLFGIRLLLNLVYILTSPGKSGAVRDAAAAMTAVSAFPVIGQVVVLLLMLCWASAETAIDLRALTEGKKVAVIKDEASWQLDIDGLIRIATEGASAAEFTKESSKGLNYLQYLTMMVFITAEEKQLVRMTNLIESNIRLEDSYEDFSFAQSICSAQLHADYETESRFFPLPGLQSESCGISYSY